MASRQQQRWSPQKIRSALRNSRAVEGGRTWQITAVDGTRALFSDAGQSPPPLLIGCPLRGRYTVSIETINPTGSPGALRGALAVELPGSGERMVVLSHTGCGSFHFGNVVLSGGAVKVSKLNTGPVGIVSLTFRKTDARSPYFSTGARGRTPVVWGIADQNDQARDIGSADIDDIASGVRYHRELGFNTISWHMYLGCCEYPTGKGTVFPAIDPCDPEHLRLLSGQPERAGFELVFRELIHRYDCMLEGQRLAHGEGMAFMPCLRMNNEWHADWVFEHITPEFAERFWCPEFFTRHPEYWSEYKGGGRSGGGMDYAHPAVRRYRLAIVHEILERYPALDGLFMDLHRHPPMVLYPDHAVRAFKKQTGLNVRTVRPLREDTMDPRWLKFRAGYFTTFMRRVRATKAALGVTTPTVVRTATTVMDCLREGADLEAWFDERLVDVLILERPRPPYDADVAPVVDAARAAGVTVLGGFANPSFVAETPWRQLARIMDRWLDEGAAGVAFYESNRVVCCDNLRKNLPQWVRARGG